ncbi:MAG: PIN domain-containing protein [Solirubrobacteraceae bacterium]
MAGLTLDTGALIAYERADARVREILATAFARGIVPTVPAVAIAEVWRGDARDVRVARLLKACNVEPHDERCAKDAGALRRKVADAGAIDAAIAVGAQRRGDSIATSDPEDMRRLLGPGAKLLTI